MSKRTEQGERETAVMTEQARRLKRLGMFMIINGRVDDKEESRKIVRNEVELNRNWNPD